MSKPDLTLYRGQKVVDVIYDPQETHNWYVELEGGARVINQSREETIPPGREIIGAVLTTVLLSFRDTTLVFRAANGHVHKLSLAPTYYAIHEPGYGGIVYPQWPEELEQGGVPATPEGGISDQPQPGWEKTEQELQERAQQRRQQEAAQFIEEEEEGQ